MRDRIVIRPGDIVRADASWWVNDEPLQEAGVQVLDALLVTRAASNEGVNLLNLRTGRPVKASTFGSNWRNDWPGWVYATDVDVNTLTDAQKLLVVNAAIERAKGDPREV